MLNTEINNLIWNDQTILQRKKEKESGISFLIKTPLKQHYPLIQINERNKEATIPLIDEEEEGKEEKTNNTLNVKATTPSNTFLMSLQLRTKGLRFQILFNELLKRYVWDWWIQISPLNSNQWDKQRNEDTNNKTCQFNRFFLYFHVINHFLFFVFFWLGVMNCWFVNLINLYKLITKTWIYSTQKREKKEKLSVGAQTCICI